MGKGEGNGNILTLIVWIILFILSFWVAFFSAWLYVIVFPVTACLDGLSPISDICLRGAELPYFFLKCLMENSDFSALSDMCKPRS